MVHIIINTPNQRPELAYQDSKSKRKGQGSQLSFLYTGQMTVHLTMNGFNGTLFAHADSLLNGFLGLSKCLVLLLTPQSQSIPPTSKVEYLTAQPSSTADHI